MKKIVVVLSIMFVASLLIFSGCAKDEGDVIKIGVIGPMSEMQGEEHWNGATMARDEINEAGGVKVGDKQMMIKLIKADSNETRSPTDASAAMDKLINYHKVDFVVGGFRTEGVMAMQPVAMAGKKLFIDCGAAGTQLCDVVSADYEKNKYFFRGTPFNSTYLIKTSLIHLITVADFLKSELGVEKPKVAVVIEKAAWADAMIGSINGLCKAKGYDNVGAWKPSPNATDVSAELAAIQDKEPDIIFTIISGAVGVPVVKQKHELGIPAIMVGINVESQNENFPKSVGAEAANYVFTMNTYCKGIEQNELTKPFMDMYIEKFDRVPSYTADTYAFIKYCLVPVVEQAGTLDSDVLVPIIEEREFKTPAGIVKYTDKHDLTWGPGYLTSLGVQWQDGVMKGVWPNGWVAAPGAPAVTYKGMVPIQLPPALIAKYKK